MNRIIYKIFNEIHYCNRITFYSKQNQNETNTINGLILPLLEWLGYEYTDLIFEDTKSLTTENNDRPDITLLVNDYGLPLECKKINEKITDKIIKEKIKYLKNAENNIFLIICNGKEICKITKNKNVERYEIQNLLEINKEVFKIFSKNSLEKIIREQSDVNQCLANKMYEKFTNNDDGNILVISGGSKLIKPFLYGNNKIFYIDFKKNRIESIKKIYGEYDIDFIIAKNEKDILNCLTKLEDKMFKKCIMNPPYGGGGDFIYGQIYNKVMEKMTEDGEVASLQPINAYNKTFLEIKKGEPWEIIKENLKNIDSIDILKKEEVDFDADLRYPLGIIYNKSNIREKININTKLDELKLSIYKKIKNKQLNSIQSFSKKEYKGFSIKISTTHGHFGKEDFYDLITPQEDLVLNKTIISEKQFYCEFKTKREALNFYNSLQTIFMKFVNSIYKTSTRLMFDDFPYMNDYKSEWIDKKFFNYFEIDNEEQKQIIKWYGDYICSCQK
ncbi:MAG: hypothetical protein Ta2D_07750 [Rickettsiales bacterium]|nr:MAG: hypothetical protein Ta2D_07750 [Rickettsiales bacterium]